LHHAPIICERASAFNGKPGRLLERCLLHDEPGRSPKSGS
jgi:hypothetical protein